MRFSGYAIVIGAMKSGTTSLHHILKQHPDIVTGVRKELNFFRPGKEQDGLELAYEKLFPRLDKARHAYTLDSSPSYTKTRQWDSAPALIARLPGRKRLIYVLRHPIERIDSHIAHNIAQGRWTANEWPASYVLAISAYARHLAKFEEAGLLDDILLVDFAELISDPVAVAYRVHDFLGIRRVEPRSIERRNSRKVDGSFIRREQLPRLAQALRNDVQTLITKYEFEAAKSWGIEGLSGSQREAPARSIQIGNQDSPQSVEHLRYALGFLAGADKEGLADHFRRIEYPLPLAVHPRTRFAVAAHATQPLALLGEAVHPDLPHLDLEGVAEHLSRSGPNRQQEIDKLVGRFAVIQGDSQGDFRIQTDAIGMRAVFFSTAGKAAICGSHASLVARAAVHPPPKQKSHPFRWGYPGISTPYDSVYRLPPNCEFSLSSGRVLRFFPHTLIPEVRIEDAWDFAFNRANAAIKALTARHKLLVSLTAGLDSRTTLAATRDTWSRLLFFTYDRGDHKHQVDFDVARDLSAALGFRHLRVRYSANESRQMLKMLAGNTFTSHQRSLACAYHRQFGEGDYLHIRSNLLELGRSNLFFKFGKRQGFEAPDTAARMGAFYNRAAKLDPDRAGHVIPAFEHYIAVSDYGSTLGKASPWDLYFVEHRMGAWHSGAVLESDVSFDTVIVFNSREIVRHFMGVPQEVRSSSKCLRKKLDALLPEVKDIPVNPRWYSRRSAA